MRKKGIKALVQELREEVDRCDGSPEDLKRVLRRMCDVLGKLSSMLVLTTVLVDAIHQHIEDYLFRERTGWGS